MTTVPCPFCGLPNAPHLLANAKELRAIIVRLIAFDRPSWSVEEGICPDCALRFARQFAVQRSHQSLHSATDPNTTFPYYHPAEEAVLSLPERLADYSLFGGNGVTIAFLDSGYYPSPDLTRQPSWPGREPAWRRLELQHLRTMLETTDLRLLNYVDLTDHGERVGLDLASLWDGAGDSWHGHMTTTIAAGNGLLSGGRYRGFAPQASILPIKIGRGGGRIPEEDILHGLNWLLRDDNWQRYNVRVVNISVGGDFPQPWQDNPVCRAAHALTERGVVVAAAAGNRGGEELLAPAQTPTVLTVGGIEDHNRRWRSDRRKEVETLALYHHNYGTVVWRQSPIRKPELLALGRWVPVPILPPSHVFKETVTIDRLRRVLQGEDDDRLGMLLAHWKHTLHPDTVLEHTDDGHWFDTIRWMPEMWEALRKRMNAHKWVQPFYQHVDGTSVAVAQVSAVVAQMIEANSSLRPEDVRRILIETALRLPHLLPPHTTAGLLYPSLAVAAALRAQGGPLVGVPLSGSPLAANELHKWNDRGTLTVFTPETAQSAQRSQLYYFGCLAPGAHSVSLIGSFNRWQVESMPLQPIDNGWWHAAVYLPQGEHLYRFWIESQDRPHGAWRRDLENPIRGESGFVDDHSIISF